MLVLTFAVTAIWDLVTAVAVGLGVAVVVALRAVARRVKPAPSPVAGTFGVTEPP